MTNPPDYRPACVLAIGAHPDDIEIVAAGTLLRLVADGLTVCLLDLTRGEKGTTGSAEVRAREAAAATAKLGAQSRHNLRLPDGGVRADDATADRLVRAIRAVRPRVLLAPHAEDAHPDHQAAAAATERACFLAGQKDHAPELGAPFRPELVLRCPATATVEAALAVDIGDRIEAKAAVIACYASQLSPADRSHLPNGLDILERAQVRDRFYGARISALAAEPFCHDGPLPLSTVSSLLRG